MTPNEDIRQDDGSFCDLSKSDFGARINRELAGDLQRNTANLDQKVEEFQRIFQSVEQSVGRVIVGLREELKLVVASVFMGGNVLMEGKPGLAKTLMVRSIADTLGLEFARIQFTPDLLPGDVTGSMVQTASREFEFRKGPLFANIVLADEINRTGPKTQAALLEAMQEMQVTYDKVTYRLPQPFVVLATQNPLESAGTYPLPDAQLDRFALKIVLNQPNKSDMKRILCQTTAEVAPTVNCMFTPAEAEAKILEMRNLIKRVNVPEEIAEQIVNVCVSLHPDHEERIKVKSVTQHVESGPSPRGAQAVALLAKVFALLDGRTHVAPEDVKRAYIPTLRHRVGLRVEAISDNVKAENIIQDVVRHVHD
jgi:MoxR-like ATPase